jgi:hypothetical protein
MKEYRPVLKSYLLREFLQQNLYIKFVYKYNGFSKFKNLLFELVVAYFSDKLSAYRNEMIIEELIG